MACRTEFSIGQKVEIVRATGNAVAVPGQIGTLCEVRFDRDGVRFFVNPESGLGPVIATKIKVAKAEAKPAPAQPAPAAAETKT
jgi:hypothetical protein